MISLRLIFDLPGNKAGFLRVEAVPAKNEAGWLFCLDRGNNPGAGSGEISFSG